MHRRPRRAVNPRLCCFDSNAALWALTECWLVHNWAPACWVPIPLISLPAHLPCASGLRRGVRARSEPRHQVSGWVGGRCGPAGGALPLEGQPRVPPHAPRRPTHVPRTHTRPLSTAAPLPGKRRLSAPPPPPRVRPPARPPPPPPPCSVYFQQWHLCCSMSAYFSNDTVALPGCAKFFAVS